jgi:hypothetical protein|tara:strand:+ start:83 stop:442 length:360 start_codon:yes stop_codon:yes gene_type:complete
MKLPTLRLWPFIGTIGLLGLAYHTNGQDLPQDTTKQKATRVQVPLVVQADRLAIFRLESGQSLSSWSNAKENEFFSITGSPEELSIICMAFQRSLKRLSEPNGRRKQQRWKPKSFIMTC